MQIIEEKNLFTFTKNRQTVCTPGSLSGPIKTQNTTIPIFFDHLGATDRSVTLLISEKVGKEARQLQRHFHN